MVGFAAGLFFRSLNPDQETISLIGFPGRLVIRCFILLIVPLLVCSVILGVSSFGKGGGASRIVIFTVSFFIGLAVVCSVLGTILGYIIQPGSVIAKSKNETSSQFQSTNENQILDSILDVFRNAMPDNIVEATFVREVTVTKPKEAPQSLLNSSTEMNSTNNTSEYVKEVIMREEVNYIGLLVFSILFGCVLSSLGDKASTLKKVIEEINEVIMQILNVLLCAPALPMSIRIMEEKIKIHPSVTRSVLPLGMMVHKNGLSIDLPIKVLFLTQILGLELGFDKLVLMNFVVFLLTIASPTVSIGPYPAFLVTTLSLLGIPTPPSISLIVAFEWM
ncbi:putative sodium-dependent excitatory amino acid transporter glt-3, partial [Limulus polyphemus]|uniref:Amino acid transporter n=1 Tax=Limulus polyphemus TaxID=6850 RepID=A0ABM1B3Y8_LIMPO